MKSIKALILGDLVGQPGIRALFYNIATLKKKYPHDILIVNGENASEGFGITPEQVDLLFKQGVDVITSGNHIWQRSEILPELERQKNLLRPDNYPPGVEGHGWTILPIKDHKVAVVNIMGRVRMGNPLDCPFRHMSKLVAQLRQETPMIIVDFHAEDVMEKEALALHLDGKISLQVGTHTHVQTMDEKILPNGTGYISDLGMCGVQSSVIGTDPELSIRRYMTQMPLKSEIVEGKEVLHGVYAEIDCMNGITLHLERVKFPE